MSQSDEIVAVGDFLGVVEEYIPGFGTYESDGKIFSSFVGYKRVDRQRLEISIEPAKKKEIIVPQIGDVVICEVVMARKQSAMVHIFKIRNHFLFDTYPGMVHVSNMSQNYLNNVEEGFRPTDIIRAKIIGKNFTEYELSTKYPELGCIHCECISCGSVLQRDGNQLVCNTCGFPNPRKIAKDYGHVRERIDNM
ncbi:MAG TPA: exosome complex RNA-binding protein Csl4 [Candidatus Lokiarchaeia archaeon]|nr:exosome complex RNA-binding protein Csl4 [Candidatus Lokiarchaeia archaeon]